MLRFPGKRILIVDDEESIRELVSDSLRSRDIEVDCAASSEEALELAARHSYDTILCDLNLESAVRLANLRIRPSRPHPGKPGIALRGEAGLHFHDRRPRG